MNVAVEREESATTRHGDSNGDGDPRKTRRGAVRSYAAAAVCRPSGSGELPWSSLSFADPTAPPAGIPSFLIERGEHCEGQCDLEPVCPVRNNWRKINHVIRNALENLSLFHMARELPRQPRPRSEEGFSRLVVVSGKKRSA